VHQKYNEPDAYDTYSDGTETQSAFDPRVIVIYI